MKYIDVDNNGSLFISETIVPDVCENECLIRVKAIGVNRADILQKQGKYAPPKGESLILGIEVCGVIEVCSVNHPSFKKGDKVCAIVPGGGYAELVKVKANHLISLPCNFSYEQGAALAETYLTAFQTLVWLGMLNANDQVLIHAGASGVGTAAIQIAKQLGATVTVTVGSKSKSSACIELGADHAINYTEVDFLDWQQNNIPQGFNLILDCVAGDYTNRNLAAAAMDATIVTIAILGGRFVEKFDMAKMLMKRLRIIGSTLRNQSDEYKAKLVKALIDRIDLNELDPVVYRTIDWHNANEAHRILESNENIGKVVMLINSTK